MATSNKNLFCRECSSLLYPKADTPRRTLMFACRNCDWEEEAESPCVYRNDLIVATREVAGLVDGVALDPTLPRSNIECPKCKQHESVYFQGQGKRTDTRMTLFFVCCNCSVRCSGLMTFAHAQQVHSTPFKLTAKRKEEPSMQDVEPIMHEV